MTNSLLFHNSFRNCAFYDYLKSINDNVLVYYYPRLRTYLNDVFSRVESKEIQKGERGKHYIFLPFYIDQSETLHIQKDQNHIISTNLYIIPPDIKILSSIVKNIQSVNSNANTNDSNENNGSTVPENRILFFPRKTEECMTWLDHHNSQNNYFFVDEDFVEFDYLPIDEKLLLIPFVDFFYRVFEREDFSLLKICADVLTKIQFFYGKIPKVRIHGQISKKIYDIFRETTSKISDNEFPKNRMFNNLIIIDRTTDLLTPLLPQISYDGIIEESFILDNGMISITHNNVTKEYPITQQISNKIKQPNPNHNENLSSTKAKKQTNNQQKIHHSEGENKDDMNEHEIEIIDNIHDYIKYRSIFHDIHYLEDSLKNIRMHRSRLHMGSSLYTQNTSEISINGKVYENSDLGLLERSAQYLLDLVTDAINRCKEYVAYMQLREQLYFGFQMRFDDYQKSIQTFLYAEENALFATQLLMTWCMINGSVPEDVLEEFCNEIEFRYGSQASEQLHFIQRINLISKKDIKKSYSSLNKIFNLSMAPSRNSMIDDYEIYDGYFPLSIRIIQEDLETIPGAFTEKNDGNANNITDSMNPSSEVSRRLMNKSYIEMLSSTIGNRHINLSHNKPKGIELFKAYFDDQYQYIDINSKQIKKNEKKLTHKDKKNSQQEVNLSNNEKIPAFDKSNNNFNYDGNNNSNDDNNNNNDSKMTNKKKPIFDDVIDNTENTLIFFVGGVTQLELSWLNWLTKKHFNEKSTVVALTTGIYTADRFIKECLPCLREDHPSLKEMTDNAIKLYSTNSY